MYNDPNGYYLSINIIRIYITFKHLLVTYNMILNSTFHTFSIHTLVFKIFERNENVGKTSLIRKEKFTKHAY